MRAGCIVNTTFYTTLMVQTLAPIVIFGLIILYYGISTARHGADDAKRLKCRDFGYTFFLTLTYLVFASVSKTVFDTFNCSAIGDDPTLYLARDHR